MSLTHLVNRPSKSLNALLFLLAAAAGMVIGLLPGKVENTFLLVAAGVGFILAFITLLNVEFGLLVFIIFTYLRVSDVAVHNYNAPSIARILVLLLVVAVLLRWTVTNQIPRGWGKPALLVLAYALVIFGSILYASDYLRAQEAAANYWKDGLITIIMAALIQNKSTFRHVIWVLIIAGILTGTLSVYQYLTGTFDNTYLGFAEAPIQNIIGETEGNRVAGPIGDPNFYAQILVVLVPLAVNRMISEKSWVLKLVAGYAVLVITLSIIYTFSRGGMIALVAALLALAFYKPPKLHFIVIMLAFGWIMLLLMPGDFLSRMGTITGVLTGKMDTRSEVSFRGRTSEMLSAWFMFIDNPILGVGADNYPIYYQTYARRLGLDPRATIREPHNLFLQVAAETGILGILIFGFLLVFIFRCIHNARLFLTKSGDRHTLDLVGAFSAGLIGYLTAAMFIHGAYPRYFWLLAGIAMALPQVAAKDQSHQ